MAHSHRLTARPGSRNRLIPQPRQANAPLAGSQSAFRQSGPTVSAPRQSIESGPPPGALVSRTEQRALQSGLIINSALGLRASHLSGVSGTGPIGCRSRSSWANWRMPSAQPSGTRTVTLHSPCARRDRDGRRSGRSVMPVTTPRHQSSRRSNRTERARRSCQCTARRLRRPLARKSGSGLLSSPQRRGSNSSNPSG